ncbi:adenine-specific methyltransferase EcoRI family protein [Mesomycoplasma molare]|uniref:Adenine-specific methyltransferase EcoRI family protein n=1 Tax=Mesomycoplasma molare TaxID=171288 RepID=A0ABY5TTP7_9BACT|nr:adenine-specific methyltransferase EcoRI family protein [Mesomycoplasma molare]UWD34039.1 adenine-specific methyltransferase EcoRI family protein [Mesomycoplasma molare]
MEITKKKKTLMDITNEWFKAQNKPADKVKLEQAKVKRADEFYTPYELIEKEMELHQESFENKTLYLPADDLYLLEEYFDDPESRASQFWVYFHKNFKRLKLKKLIATSMKRSGNAFAYIYQGGDDNNIEEYEKEELNNNGDFRNLDNFKFFEQADIIVTNPPFSIFKDFWKIIQASGKQFLILGGLLTFANVLFMKDLIDKKYHFGYTEPHYFYDYNKDEFGNVKTIKSTVPTLWYTNLPKKHGRAVLQRKLDGEKQEYKWHYVDAETIHISSSKYWSDVQELKAKYYLVPITLIFKLDIDNEWDILGTDENNILNKKFGEIRVNGKEVFRRLLIRKRENKNE